MLKALDAGSDVSSMMLSSFERLGDAAKRRLDPAINVRRFLDGLRADGLTSDAVDVLTHLLPKQYAIAWGCECWEAAHQGRDVDQVDRSAFSAAQRWLKEPTEEHRKAALELADRLGYKTSGAWLAAAAGWTGGSMVPGGKVEVPPAAGLPGVAVAAALKLAAAVDPATFDRKLGEFVDRALTTFSPSKS
jgi:hypothetical protein